MSVTRRAFCDLASAVTMIAPASNRAHAGVSTRPERSIPSTSTAWKAATEGPMKFTRSFPANAIDSAPVPVRTIAPMTLAGLRRQTTAMPPATRNTPPRIQEIPSRSVDIVASSRIAAPCSPLKRTK